MTKHVQTYSLLQERKPSNVGIDVVRSHSENNNKNMKCEKVHILRQRTGSIALSK